VSPVLPIRIPIPTTFHSDETEQPFRECLVCECSLHDGSTEYLVEKAYRHFDEFDVTETVFEYAICLSCHLEIVESFSELSRTRCEAYFDDHVDLSERAARLLSTQDDPREEGAPEEPSGPSDRPRLLHATPDPDDIDLNDWLDGCIVHGTPMEDLSEFQILGHCTGDQLLLSHLPVAIGGRAMDELAERLSNETLDELGGFRDEYFGLPPELKRDLSGPVFA
jgi:hypothetical protein